MIDNLVRSILYKLNSDNQFTETQLEEIKYSILVIWADFSKLLILFIVFSLCDRSMEFLYAVFTTVTLRIYIGGMHFNTYLRCFVFSTIYFSALIFFANILPSEFDQHLMLFSILSFLILIVIAPQISRKSKRKLKIKKVMIKFMVLLFCIIYTAINYVKKEPIYTIGSLTIIFQTILLLIMKGVSYIENLKEEKHCKQYS